MSNILQTFRSLAASETPPIVELISIDQKPVGAVYLSKIQDPMKIVISETNNLERYYFYYDGLAVFFSFWQVVSK